MPAYYTNRASITGDQNHWTGTNGWGNGYGTWATAWSGGFSGWDIWGGGTDHPQGSGYVHAQGIVSGQHYATSDGGQAYGWMMVGAHNATDNRYWLRGKWGGGTSGWVEMITTGNIGSQSVAYATNAGNADTLDGIDSSAFFRDNQDRRLQVLRFTGEGGNSGVGNQAYALYQEGGGWGFPYPDLVINYHVGMKFGANASYEGYRFYDDYGHSAVRFQINGGSGYTYKYTWMYTNTNGFYSDTNGAHLYPNTGSSYGSWRIDGQRSGWYGLSINTGNSPHVMFDGSGNGGFYNEGGGRWILYYSHGNDCTGMGTSTTSSSYGLYVRKAIYSTGDIIAYSDRRKKDNIVTVDDALAKVMKMRGVYYTRIDDEDKKRQIGVIAQEVQEVLPEAVTYASDIDEYGVAYGNISGLLIEAIKEQQQIINKQQSEIDELKDLVKQLLNK